MGSFGISRWRVERAQVDAPARCGILHRLITLENQPLRPVLAIPGLVAGPDDWKGVYDVFDLGAGYPVEMEERGIDLAAEAESALLVPAKRWALVSAPAGDRCKIRRSEDQLEDSG
jgi:hypothetical protein